LLSQKATCSSHRDRKPGQAAKSIGMMSSFRIVAF
jgi:hypothetical protein